MNSCVYDVKQPLRIAFDVYDEKLTPMALAKSIVDSEAIRTIWSVKDIAELTEYLKVYVRYHALEE